MLVIVENAGADDLTSVIDAFSRGDAPAGVRRQQVMNLRAYTVLVQEPPGPIRPRFDHAAAQNYLGASIFWLRRAAALGGEEATIAHWQIKRGGKKRGIIEVIGP